MLKKSLFSYLVTSVLCFATMSIRADKLEVAVISTKYGNMVIRFYEDAAPKHVASFKQHAANKYYDKTLFHRIVHGFVIQGGDPLSKQEQKSMVGTGGRSAIFYGVGQKDNPDSWTLPAEFNGKKHVKGTLAMARSHSPDSAGSQFYICLDRLASLDGQYTVFGELITGQEVLDKIGKLPTDEHDQPLDPIEMTVTIEQRDV